jgi:beta-N-acetylhexosaminidase
MATQLEDLVGSKLVVGIPGTKATPEIIKHLRDIHAGGIIFYRINFESPAQIRKLITDLENGLGRKLLVCVDHEGGRVIMYRDGVTVFPDNLTLGTAGDIELVRKQGEMAAKELRALGTDVNFSPVLDVLTPSYSPNIGIRSYGEDYKKVAEFGAAYIKALQAGGVSATAKHFPGKGHAPVDAHLKLPTIQSSWDEMKAVHLQPFLKAIEARVDCIMSSHPRYPKLVTKNESSLVIELHRYGGNGALSLYCWRAGASH